MRDETNGEKAYIEIDNIEDLVKRKGRRDKSNTMTLD